VLPEKSTPESAPNPGFSDNVGRLVTASRNRSIFIQMISTHAFAEDALARAGVPALSIDPSGSRKAHYFRDDTVVEATDMVSRDSSCRHDSIAMGRRWSCSSMLLATLCAIPLLHDNANNTREIRILKMTLRIFFKAIT